jgi:hypothetical protein
MGNVTSLLTKAALWTCPQSSGHLGHTKQRSKERIQRIILQQESITLDADAHSIWGMIIHFTMKLKYGSISTLAQACSLASDGKMVIWTHPNCSSQISKSKTYGSHLIMYSEKSKMNLTEACSHVHACSLYIKLCYGISFNIEIIVSNFKSQAISCTQLQTSQK